MNPVLKKAMDKQQADKVKLTVKKLLKQIDGENKGTIKFEVFSNLLSLHKIRLAPRDLNKLRLQSRAKPKAGAGDVTDLIDYKTALRTIDINLDVDEPLAKEWVLKTGNGNLASQIDTLSIRTSVFSHKSNIGNYGQSAKQETKTALGLLNKQAF